MGKQPTKQVFGVPSAEVIEATENAQAVNEIRTANFRYEAQLRELERQFEVKAGELRQAYLDEVRAILWRLIKRGPSRAEHTRRSPNHRNTGGVVTMAAIEITREIPPVQKGPRLRAELERRVRELEARFKPAPRNMQELARLKEFLKVPPATL